MLFGFSHGVWLKLTDDDVSELFVSPIYKVYGLLPTVSVDFENGTDKKFRNVVIQPKPHTVGKTRNRNILQIAVKV